MQWLHLRLVLLDLAERSLAWLPSALRVRPGPGLERIRADTKAELLAELTALYREFHRLRTVLRQMKTVFCLYFLIAKAIPGTCWDHQSAEVISVR